MSLTGTANTNIAIESDVNLTTDGIIDQFLTPPAPNQPGPNTIADAVDSRPTDAIWQNNLLTFVSTYPCTPTGDSTMRDCVRVSQLDTTGVTAAASLTPQAKLPLDSLACSSTRTSSSPRTARTATWVASGWPATAPSTSCGLGRPRRPATSRRPTPPISCPPKQPNSISPKELLKAGTGVYTGERWGDYVGVAQDPLVPSAVWQGNQYSGTGTEWKTWVSRLQPAGTTYVAGPPVRVLDTRPGRRSGCRASSRPRSPGPGRSTEAVGSIPAGAVAVTGNVTVTQQEAVGFVAVTPTATNSPPSSTINVPLDDNRANNLTVPLSSTGTLSATYVATTGKKTHLIFDVTGYFLADDTGATFTPAGPGPRARHPPGRRRSGCPARSSTASPRQLTIAGTQRRAR